MNTSDNEERGNMKAAWLGWAWVLPQVILGCLNWHAWILVRGDMTPVQQSQALHIGIFEALLLAFGVLAWILQTTRRKPVGLGLALAAFAAHTGYLWLFLQDIDRLLPATVSLWMLPQTELVFYQFSLMMPVVFLMLVRLARIKIGLSTPLDVGLSFATLVIIPAGAFIFGSLIVRLERTFSLHDSLQYVLITAMVAGTACILVAFLRLMLRLHDLIQSRSWSLWAIPLTAGIVAPLAGLALNASIPFPYDFQDPAVYLMTILNGGALLIPFRPGTRSALGGWAARVALYPFTVYFFLVFLPFLPLSLLAMIVAGAGFLILAPLLLFSVHTRRLWEQGRVLAAQYGTARMLSTFTLCILILPALFMVRNEMDRRTLSTAVDAVYSPDYEATRVPIRTAALQRALDRMDDMKHGIYLPYLSDIYDAWVFRGMVLPDEKADVIRRSLLGAAPVASGRSGIWDNGFFGRGSRNGRRTRGSGVASHEVVLASHGETIRQTNGVTEAEIQLVLENRAGANGEFSQPITVPEGVLVTGFWLEVNGTNKTAQIRERKAATWVYEMIRDMTRRDPGLVVYEDDQHLRLRVYPFAAGETRRCGLRFRFPAALHPSVKLQDTTIALDSAVGSTAVSSILPGGEAALIVPAASMTNLPSFRREVVAHLILDHSACSRTNMGAVITRAQAAVKALPSSIKRVQITWANYEQEDLSGEPLSREDAIRLLDQTPTLPYQGGFCAERVIARVLLLQEDAPRNPEPAGYASLFVVIPAPGSNPVRAGSLAPFARLAPDLPAYAVFDGTALTPVPFHPVTSKTTVQPVSLSPKDVVAICPAQGSNNTQGKAVSAGRRVSIVAPGESALVFAPACDPANWEVWNPASNQFKPLEACTPCNDPAYLAGLSLWSHHRALTWSPGQVDAALPDLVKGARDAGLLIPETAFIVLETQAQDVMLARKERQSLAANHALEFDEAKTEKAPAPPALWLVVPALWLLWRMKKKVIVE